jgi:hypothetical protein
VRPPITIFAPNVTANTEDPDAYAGAILASDKFRFKETIALEWMEALALASKYRKGSAKRKEVHHRAFAEKLQVLPLKYNRTDVDLMYVLEVGQKHGWDGGLSPGEDAPATSSKNVGRSNATAASKLRIARALEPRNRSAALELFKVIVRDFGGTPEAKTAAERIKALEGK